MLRRSAHLERLIGPRPGDPAGALIVVQAD
jgi:hypothetical protein